jgi:DNA-directed DNA polymerase III PolC
MKFKNFADPHVHPNSLDSGCGPDSFLERELELESGTITSTDHGDMSACHRVYTLAKANNLIPILGMEGYFRDDNCDILKAHGIAKDDDGTYRKYLKYKHFCIHACDYQAYEAICKKLSWTNLNRSERHGSENKPIMNWNDLEELSHYNLTITSGCLIGMISRDLVFKNRPDIAEAYFKRMSQMFGDKLYVEIFPFEVSRHWVDGIFLKLADNTELKFYSGKKLITDQGEFTAQELSKEFNKKHNKIKTLLGIKNRSEIEDKNIEIIGVKEVADFLTNECTEQSPDADYHIATNKFGIYLAEKYGHKKLLSSDAHLAYAEQKVVQDIKLTNNATGHSWKFADALTRMSSDQAWLYSLTKLNISEYQFQNMIDNSHEWANKFKNFEFKNKPSLPSSFYPKETVKYLKALIDKHGRMNWDNPVYRERLASEIELLKENGVVDFLSYFFLSEESRAIYEENEQLTGPGRGSSGGLLIAFLLGITDLDPIRHDLSKDRFLTLDRVKSGHFPDIDSDFPNRSLLIDENGEGFLKKRFGDCFSQISTDVKLRIRSCIKDVHRARYGSVSKEIDQICSKLPVPPQGIKDHDFIFGYLDGDGHDVPGIFETCDALKYYAKTYPAEWEIVSLAVSSISKAKSVHASAFVIADRPIGDFIPITKSGDAIVTQMTAESVESLGGIKMDFLVVNSLNDIEGCLKMLHKRFGKPQEKKILINGVQVPSFRTVSFKGQLYDIWDLPQEQEVYEDIVKSKTETVFQLDTNSAMTWLHEFDFKNEDKFGLSSIQDLAVFIALDRPGPLDMNIGNKNMLQLYADRVKRNDPGEGVFSELLPKTKAILIYQEDLSKVFQHFTGCSNADAEEFRSFSAKKKKEKMIKAKSSFMERATKKVSKDVANHVWNTMETFAAYSFNKSHSTAYALISYATAFLKHFYPLEWWSSVLSNASKNDIEEKFIKHCGDLLLDPDINKSDEKFSIDGNKIRSPLTIIEGIGPAVHKTLNDLKPYSDIHDFCQKIYGNTNTKRTVPKPIIQKLILGGVMDDLFSSNSTLLDKMQIFNQEFALARNEKKIDAVSEELINLTQIKRLILKKSILPLSRIELTKTFVKLNPNFFSQQENKVLFRQHGKHKYLLYNTKALNEYNQYSGVVPSNGIRACAIGYVIKTRFFKFGPNKEKEAAEVYVDIDGDKFGFVKWPDWGKNDCGISSTLEGTVCLILLSKRKEGKPFSIEQIIKIED